MSAKFDQAARDLIERHGSKAVHVAVERLNHSIDQHDRIARDFWTRVVYAIHEHQPAVPSNNKCRLVENPEERIAGKINLLRGEMTVAIQQLQPPIACENDDQPMAVMLRS